MCFQLRASNITLNCFVTGLKKKLWNSSESSVEELGWICIFCVRASWRWCLVSYSGGGQRRDLHFSPHGSHPLFLFPHWSNIPLMKPSGFLFRNYKLQNRVNYLFSLTSLCGTRWFHSFMLSIFYQHMALERFLGFVRQGENHSFSEHWTLLLSFPVSAWTQSKIFASGGGWYFKQSQGVTFS